MTKRKERVRKPGQLRALWTKEEIHFAIWCYQEGYSASAAAIAMTEREMRKDCKPVTRNAIIGLWNRIQVGEQNKVTNEIRKPTVKLKKKKKESKANYAISKKGVLYPPSLHFIERMDQAVVENKVNKERTTIRNIKEGQCKFPFSDPRSEDFHFCGEAVDYNKGRSYCTFHYKLCYIPSRAA